MVGFTVLAYLYSICLAYDLTLFLFARYTFDNIIDCPFGHRNVETSSLFSLGSLDHPLQHVAVRSTLSALSKHSLLQRCVDTSTFLVR